MMSRSSNYGRMSGNYSKTTSSNKVEVEAEAEAEIKWEMRPGGMLVQKRIGAPPDVSAPNLCLRIAFGALRYQISVSSQATFGNAY